MPLMKLCLVWSPGARVRRHFATFTSADAMTAPTLSEPTTRKNAWIDGQTPLMHCAPMHGLTWEDVWHLQRGGKVR